MGEFLMHSSVVWLNPHPSLGRVRKDPEMTVFGKSAVPPLETSIPLGTTGQINWISVLAVRGCVTQTLRQYPAFILSGFPREAFTSRTKPLICFSVTSLQESSDTGLQGKQQAEEEAGKHCVRFTQSFVPQTKRLISLLSLTRPTLVQHFLTAIQTPLSSAGSSRSLRCRSDWAILQVRVPLNRSQSASTESFCSSASFVLPRTHTLPPSLSSSETIDHIRTGIKCLSSVPLLSQEQAQKVAASGS